MRHIAMTSVLSIVVFAACGTTGTRTIYIGDIGADFEILAEGSFNQAKGQSVQVDADGSVPVSGAPVPVKLGIDSPALVGDTQIYADSVKGTVRYIIRGSGNQNFDSAEIIHSASRTHTLLGELESQIEP